MTLETRKLYICTTLLLFLFSFSLSLWAASGCDGAGNCYVRAGATGSNSGVDWTNAYTDLPASPTRGVTYYVAAGTYTGHTFQTADSGSTAIVIQAATIATHGTGTGWSNAYQGQAVFHTGAGSGGAVITFLSDYWTFNGIYRANTGAPQTDWVNESSYGFKLDNSGKVACNSDVILGGSSPQYVHDITFEYVDVNGSHETSVTGCRENGVQNVYGSYNLMFSYNYIHDTGLTILFMRGETANCSGTPPNVTCGSPTSGFGTGNNDNFLYNYFARNFSDPTQHAEGCSCSQGLQNLTIAYNYWQDIDGTGIIATASGGDWNNGNGGNGPWFIYGNVIFETGCSAYTGAHEPGISGFVYTWDTTFVGTLYILNNTLYNLPDSCNVFTGVGLGDGSYVTPMQAVYVENNLWDAAGGINIDNNCPTSGGKVTCSSITWGYNTYFASTDNSPSNDSDPNKQVSSSSAPFTNASIYDFRLTSNTSAGTSTSSIFSGNNLDLFGTTRGANGVIDRGFYQIPAGAPNPATGLTATPH